MTKASLHKTIKRKSRKLVKKILFFILLLLIWEVIYRIGFWPSWIFPSPEKVFKTLWKGLHTEDFIVGILTSMRRIGIGFGLSILFGSLLGFLIAKNKHIQETVGFLVLGLQTLPSICWLPLALLWFGLSEKAIIFVVIMGAILSMTISVEGAVKSIPPLFVRAGKMLGARGWRLYRYVIFPAILPAYITGMKQSWSFAWRSLMAGEMLFITAGLGQLLMIGRELNDMSQVISVMIIIVAIGIFFDKFIFGILEDRVRKKWGLHKN